MFFYSFKVFKPKLLLCHKFKECYILKGQIHSSILNSYLSRIRKDVTDECLDCQIHPHTTNHLFNCHENPTSLTVRDLWNNPTHVARFLRLEGGEDENGWELARATTTTATTTNSLIYLSICASIFLMESHT